MEIPTWIALGVIFGLLAMGGGCYWYLLRMVDDMLAERDAETKRALLRAIRAREVQS